MYREILEKRKINLSQLSKISKIPYSTLYELFSGKRNFQKCSMETGYKLSKALNIDLETLYEIFTKNSFNYEQFDLFKSEICHMVKNLGELGFIKYSLETNYTDIYWKENNYEKAFYILAMTDFLSKRNNIPIYNGYNEKRKYKLEKEVYPFSAILEWNMDKKNKDKIKEQYKKNAEPEFLKYGIIEGDVFNVC